VLDVQVLANHELQVGTRFCLDPDLPVIKCEDPLALGCLPQFSDLPAEHFILRLLHTHRVALALDVGSHAEAIGLDLRKPAHDRIKAGQPLRRVALSCAPAQGIVQVFRAGECRQATRRQKHAQAPMHRACHRAPSAGAPTP